MAAKKKKRPPIYPMLEALTVDELQLLIECPYDSPGMVKGEELEVAKRLIARGLLEADPSVDSKKQFIVRCTETGEYQAKPLSAAYVQHLRDEIERIYLDELRASYEAFQLERALWMRVLAEYALGGSKVASIALETADFIPNV